VQWVEFGDDTHHAKKKKEDNINTTIQVILERKLGEKKRIR